MLRCETCDEDGPLLKRHAATTSLLSMDHRRSTGTEEWTRFLIEHEWHGGLRLIHE